MIVHSAMAIDSVVSIPWKNGGGMTQQLAVMPEDAAASDFLWRISVARIDAPGEFSAFAGIDRTILLWRGDGVTLRSPAWSERRLDDPRSPYRFRGEDEVTCDLPGGPTQDLNLMVRRGKVIATFEIIDAATYSVPACDDFVLLCSSGRAQLVVSEGGQAVDIGADQFLRVSSVGKDQAVAISNGDALLVGITVRVL